MPPTNRPKTSNDQTLRGGSGKGCGFISWDRLEDRLRQIGELTPQDSLKDVKLTPDGLHYTTVTRST